MAPAVSASGSARPLPLGYACGHHGAQRVDLARQGGDVRAQAGGAFQRPSRPQRIVARLGERSHLVSRRGKLPKRLLARRDQELDPPLECRELSRHPNQIDPLAGQSGAYLPVGTAGLLGEAVAAVDGASGGRLEGHLGVLAAAAADDVEHLT